MSLALRRGCLAVLLASTAWALDPRIAVHPLETTNLSVEQHTHLAGMFEVMIARTAHLRLAGGVRVDETLAKPRGAGCETSDACLQFLAADTESLYAVYAQLRPDGLGSELMVFARVLRVDGVVMRKVSLNAPLPKGADLTETGRELLTVLVKGLELGKLPDTLPAVVDSPAVVFYGVPAPPLVAAVAANQSAAPSASLSFRRTAGFGLLGVGVATVAVGGVALALAATRRPDLSTNNQTAVRDTRIATVLIPVGAVVGIAGALLGWWPERRPVAVSVVANSQGGGLIVGGPLP